MTNKLVLSRYGNDQYRFFAVNRPILKEASYLDKYDDTKFAAETVGANIHAKVSNINLVDDVSVNKYEVSVGIARAFENDEEEWTRITDAVTAILVTTIFGQEPYETVINDQSEQYKRDAERPDYD